MAASDSSSCTPNTKGATRRDGSNEHDDELRTIHEQGPRPCHPPFPIDIDSSVTNTNESASALILLDPLSSLDIALPSVNSNTTSNSIIRQEPPNTVPGKNSTVLSDATGASPTSTSQNFSLLPTQTHHAHEATSNDPAEFHHHRVPSPSSLFVASPKITSESDGECVDHDSLGCETSDSTSIEIISGCLDDSFIASRFGAPKARLIDDLDIKKSMPSHSSGDAQSDNDSGDSLSSALDFNKHISPKVQRLSITRMDSGSTSIAPSQSVTPHPLVSREACLSPMDGASVEHPTAPVPIVNLAPQEEKLRSHTPVFTLPRIESNAESQTGAKRVMEANTLEHAVGEQETMSDDEYQATDMKTPNVYINGIPPHCPDESLFNLTKDYGTVLSVRTFTRCVGEKMSGYGFVLFASLDAAERCIEDLRRYRNLHPSFSKMLHKIPGTPYASGTIDLPPSSSFTSSVPQPLTHGALATIPTAGASQFHHPQKLNAVLTRSTSDFVGELVDHTTKQHAELTFREKLDMLSDNRTTNLYMEGLPLSIDEHTLAALVSPGQIVSCRFFKTKLSNPPRMIAFVRLDTRKAAEEVIERLNGRVVRGWNDNGSRIAVRFADTPEQRELRRADRLARGEEEDIGDTGRITMAQAALLNLRGAEFQLQTQPLPQHAVPPHLSQNSHKPRQHVNNNMQGLGFMGSQSVAMNASLGSTMHSAGQAANAMTYGQSGHERNKIPTQQILTLDSSFVRTGTNSINHRGRNRQASFSSTESFVTNPESRNNEFVGRNDIFLPDAAEQLVTAEQLAMLQQQHHEQMLKLQRLQQRTGVLNNSSQSRNQPQMLDQRLMPAVNILNDYSTSTGGRNDGVDYSLGECNLSPEIGFDYVQQHVANNAKLHRHASRAAIGKIIGYGTHGQNSIIESQAESRKSSGETDTIGEHGSALISPALTFSSRTPSTLSPTTPFLPSSFGTPASAPASVPTAKLSGPNGFRARSQYQQHHHRPSYQLQTHHRVLKA